MKRWIATTMVLLSTVISLALAIPLARVVEIDQRNTFITQLDFEALRAASLLAGAGQEQWPAIAQDVSERTGARVVIVDAVLQLVADSEGSPVDRDFLRPEIATALQGSLASDVRFSETLGYDLRYVAAPVTQVFSVVAAVRLSLPETSVDQIVQSTRLWLTLFVLAVVVAAIALALLLARAIATPLERLARVAEALPSDLELRADAMSGPPEVRAVAQALNDTAGRLAGIVARSERVAAEASHHLRTPLTGIRLRVEAIQETSNQASVRADASAAIEEVDRLHRRIDQVLALARSDAGTAPRETCLASDVIADRLGMLSASIEARHLSLETDLTEDVRVGMSEGGVARVIDELVGNALHYARSVIRVELHLRDGVAELLVVDDGTGIAPDERERIFTRFHRGRDAVAGGSGLGLALVRESVVALGGRVSVVEHPLGGLAVEVVLPAAGSDKRIPPHAD